MEAEEFLEEYPDAEPNYGELEDMGCPHCGNRKVFRVETRQMATLTNQGIDDYGESEWDRDSYCACNECDEGEDVRHFTIRGLDRLITQRRAEPTPELRQHFI